MKKLITAAVFALVSSSVFAIDTGDVKQSIPLKDGATLHVFTDGKMAMEDAYGREASMQDGATMETKAGDKITMRGNEMARLGFLLQKDKQG